jgi:hypothetical protein
MLAVGVEDGLHEGSGHLDKASQVLSLDLIGPCSPSIQACLPSAQLKASQDSGGCATNLVPHMFVKELLPNFSAEGDEFEPVFEGEGPSEAESGVFTETMTSAKTRFNTETFDCVKDHQA